MFMICTFIVSLTEVFHNMILMPLILLLFLLIAQLLIGTLRGIMEMSIVKLKCLLYKHVPLKTKMFKQSKPSWFQKQVKLAIQIRNNLYCKLLPTLRLSD